MKDQRPSPEKLLKQAQAEEQQEQRGKLKIYIGAAPGVGKTYTMLKDALAKRAQGLDVVVGVVESHGRKEIEAMLIDLEVLPRQIVEYHNNKLKEFDLDAALKRNPGLILMDEMAHTNVPGLRHAKRWQDIKEILDRGIDVYTTLNIQHIESLNNIVSQIIHARIKETVPDFMLELAATIELIDLPPEDLLKRLQEGKVYVPAQAEVAAENFFRKGNLNALRELALRVTAERVNEQVLLYRQDRGIKHIWPTKEKLLVCVGHRPESTRVIRSARRLANSLQAEWIAIHIDKPKSGLNETQHNMAVHNLRLAEQLGAETKILTGQDVVAEILNFAHEQNITKIVLQKRVRSRFKEIFFSSLADELVRHSGEIDVYIITGEGSLIRPPKIATKKPIIPWKTYIISFMIVGLATVIDYFLSPYLDSTNLIMVYLLGLTYIAWYGKIGPTITATILSIVFCDFLFIPPYYDFEIDDPQHIFTVFVMILVTQLVNHLSALTNYQTEASRLAEKRTATLHSLSRQLASTRGINKLLETAARYISEVFDSEVLILMPEAAHLSIKASYRTEQVLSAKEQGVAQWVYDLGQVAGLGTDTLPFSDALYVPMLASQGPIGVIRVRPLQQEQLISPEQMRLLEACANQIALAVEVDRLQEQAKKSELELETDRARHSLLQSVSHDLRTPLVAVMGAASTLMEMGGNLDTSNIKKIGKNIYLESEQLNRLINNLLQITYLEAENVKLQKEYHSLEKLINEVINSITKKLGNRPINITLPDNLPLIPLDDVLIQEVFMNLIDNAIKFTPPHSAIDISASLERDKVIINVEDRGPGIMHDEVNKLFEKFYRGRMLTTERGLGLGLAICLSIVKAHGGTIWAENRPDGGAAFRFTLPLKN